ncbi:hypothetical protein [Pantoea agglomerans]|uniref:Uncharacterized protein n=2 Tax=Enterobacter agglomerans TaxID=549 RepID=A0ACC5PUY3_ENTAG|nr:hypothetical protein [Pantoea agglomerans]KIC86354.1 hypothetical protein RN49_13910 [Pantoea agglomerans]MBD8128834.1 hypothetical protein [Pantoea agglomerans]MBD8244975.1 hypothetical protein [Pantoea agglomerans]NEG59716.1 hypothetical protein [Pantoea agglomerans]NEH01443.1 hypothetical protein [Pantoea agglomerans]
MTDTKIRLRHAEHCGWMVFTERTVSCFGREADARIPGLQALGYRVKKLYCKPGLIPDDGYVALFGETLRRLLEVAPGDTFALDMLSRLGTSGKHGDLFIDFTEISDFNGEPHD